MLIETESLESPSKALWALIFLVAYQQFTESYDSNFLGFAQVDSGLGFNAGGPARQRRLGGPLGMPNRFAQIMAVLVPVAIYQFRSARTRRTATLPGHCSICAASATPSPAAPRRSS